MSDPTILVLSSLADGEKHGYAMMEDIQRFAGIRLGPGTLNGSAAYLPNLLTLLVVTAYLGRQKAAAFRPFAVACALFAIALMLRTVDLAWCPRLPMGTHFLWHLLTGVLVWIIGSELTLRRYGARQMNVRA